MLLTRLAVLSMRATRGAAAAAAPLRRWLGLSEGVWVLKQPTRATHYRSGAIKPKPEEMPFGLLGVFCAVVPGLFIGAAISKSVANFLEENDLFVPSDDDDDDDD